MNLIDAALRDQEQRLLAMSPRAVMADRKKFKRKNCQRECGATVSHNANPICSNCRKAAQAARVAKL